MRLHPSFFASERPLQVLAAMLALLILAHVLPSPALFVKHMQEASWLVGP